MPEPSPTRCCHRCGEQKPREDFVRGGRNCGACRGLPYPSMIERSKRPCAWCHVIKMPEAFPWGDGNGGKGQYRRRKGVCLECVAEHKAQKAAAHAAWRATWEQDGVMVRRCRCCEQVKPLETGFYVDNRNPDGTVARYNYHCRKCQTERIEQYRRRRRTDPERASADRERKRVQQQRWRQNNPERHSATQKAYRERVKNDPELHARQRETARMAHRLKRERKDGVPLDSIRFVAPRVQARDGGGVLPASAPAETVHRLLTKLEITDETTVFERTGVYPRQLWAWRTGDHQSVQFAVAERVLTRLGLCWWDVWVDGDDYEQARAVFEAPDLRRAA